MKRLSDLIVALVILALLFVTPQSSCNRVSSSYTTLEPLAIHENGMAYVSMTTCVSCHEAIVESHMQTAHFKTSSISDFSDQLHLFAPGANELLLADQSKAEFVLEDDQAYQRWFERGETSVTFSDAMEITIGSGHRGQSFLYWKGNSLYQHQGSISGDGEQWINSPGYPSRLEPPRPIMPRCLECHATYAQQSDLETSRPTNTYLSRDILFGMQCQTCHGEAAAHVDFHRKHPEERVPQYILKYSDLTQKQRIDACALCHSGSRPNKWDPEKRIFVPSFTYQVGDDLDEFLEPDKLAAREGAVADIHANQVNLLMNSKCFQQTEAMDCTTCHDPHSFERGNYRKFSAKCINCHAGPKHSEATLTLEGANFEDCASCHMPFNESKAMQLELDVNALTPVRIRNHLIAIYKDEPSN
ncbi:MAG: hypothetical protein RLZZ242_150 [Bacteroidota bacterium]|jgi:hypothetical protein